jgi:uncharacterized protein involved in exopolysaccharide biosynthesis
MAAVALVTFAMDKVYRSQSKLLVRWGWENATLDPTATMSQERVVAIPTSGDHEINSAVEILNSRELAERVVDQIGPAAILRETKGSTSKIAIPIAEWIRPAIDFMAQYRPPRNEREEAIREYGRHLEVSPAYRSNVIVVAYEAPDPRLAQSVVAALTAEYLDHHLRVTRTPGAYSFLAEQMSQAQAKLRESESELQTLQNETGLIAPDSQRDALVAQISQIENERSSVQENRAASAAKVRRLEEILAELPATAFHSRTTGLADEGTDAMRKEFYNLQIQQMEILSKSTPAHPAVATVEEQVERSRDILDQQERQRVEETAQSSRAFEETQLSLLGEQPVLASLEAEAGVLEQQLVELRAKLKTLNDHQVEVARLKREVELRDTTYRKYAASYEQARIDHSLQAERLSNVNVIQPATLEARAVRPNALMNLALGFVAALCGSLGLVFLAESLDRSLQTTEQIEQRLDVPVLASIPRVKHKQMTVNGKGR